VIVKLLPHQKTFLKSKSKFTLLSAGLGSGKSYAGAYYTLTKVIKNPKGLGFIGANTYKQLQNATLTTLFNILDEHDIPFNYNKNSGMLSIYDANILCASMERYDFLRGIEISWFWLDEVRDMKEDAFNVLMGRLRHPKTTAHQGRLTSTPAGFNWLYDYFEGDKKKKNFEIIKGSSHDNTHLPDGYVQTLIDSLDSKMVQQEVYGRFVSTSQGAIYYGFDRKNNVREVKRNPQLPIWIGMDFNRNPMSCVIANVTSDSIYVFDEIFLHDSNTNEMAQAIIEKYKSGHTIIPDSTGRRIQTSSAGLSDHQILRDFGFRIPVTHNPFRIDRYNCCNSMLEKKRIVVDNKCSKLIRDLEQVSFKEGGSSLPNTSNADLGHVSDALGYLAYYSFPIIKPPKAKVVHG
jgi:phage terminase large subunit